MSSVFAGYRFDGPFRSADELGSEPGILLVTSDDSGELLHAEDAMNVGRCFLLSPLRTRWETDSLGPFSVWKRTGEPPEYRERILGALKYHYHLVYKGSLA